MLSVQKSCKTVDDLTITYSHPYININISAISFLHHQVRIIVGTLVECGKGNFPPEHIKSIMEATDRSYAGITAPLMDCICKVDYS